MEKIGPGPRTLAPPECGRSNANYSGVAKRVRSQRIRGQRKEIEKKTFTWKEGTPLTSEASCLFGGGALYFQEAKFRLRKSCSCPSISCNFSKQPFQADKFSKEPIPHM